MIEMGCGEWALLGLVNIDIERQKKLIQKAMKKGMEDKEDGVR